MGCGVLNWGNWGIMLLVTWFIFCRLQDLSRLGSFFTFSFYFLTVGTQQCQDKLVLNGGDPSGRQTWYLRRMEMGQMVI